MNWIYTYQLEPIAGPVVAYTGVVTAPSITKRVSQNKNVSNTFGGQCRSPILGVETKVYKRTSLLEESVVPDGRLLEWTLYA